MFNRKTELNLWDLKFNANINLKMNSSSLQNFVTINSCQFLFVLSLSIRDKAESRLCRMQAILTQTTAKEPVRETKSNWIGAGMSA